MMEPGVTSLATDQNIARAMVSALAFEFITYLSHIEWNNEVSSEIINANGIPAPPAHSFVEGAIHIIDPEEEEEAEDSVVFFDAVECSEETMRIVESIRGGSLTTVHRHRHSGVHYAHKRRSPLILRVAQRDENSPDVPSRKTLKQPPPPKEVPVRFLRAAKGDPIEGRRRYEQTLAWRKEHGMDDILFEPHPDFELIEQNYPHYYHLRGRKNEPVYYEFPPKTNLKALRAGGVDFQSLLRHYAMVNEFGWQYVERDDFATTLYIIDLGGVRVMDFVGDVVKFVRKASLFTRDHYPERCGTLMVVNVPSWFKLIWRVVRPMVDEVTLKKIRVLRGKDEIYDALLDRIPIENIPPEYGGQSMPLGEAPEERLLWELMNHNNNMTYGDVLQCNGLNGNPPCPFCSFVRARSY